MFTDDLAIRVTAAEPVWTLAQRWPEGAARDDVAATLAALHSGVPVLRDVGYLDHGPYIRPIGHRRSFYIRAPNGVVAIKGSEPTAPNFEVFIDELAASRVQIECRLGSPSLDRTLTRAELSGLEKFPIFEGKVPGCLTLREALAEAEAGAAVQRAHVERWGTLARLPLPVFVGRWPDATVDRARTALRKYLRGRALEVALAQLDGGLGVYVYRYPTVPVRLAQLGVADARRREDLQPRLARIPEPRVLAQRWIELVARLLTLGFVPKDPATLVTGDCLQVQNVVMDGGFADAESLIASHLLDDRALRDAMRRTVHELAVTLTRLLVGLWVSTVDMRDRLPDVYAVVWNDLRAALAREPSRDLRIAALLDSGAPVADQLLAIFADAL